MMRRLARPFFRLLILVGFSLLLVVAISWLRAAWAEDQTVQQAAPTTGRWLRADDVEMYVQEFGDPKATPLLLTHGTGAWSGTWDQNVQAMANAGYRVIAVDLPPFGFSTQPASRDYSRPAQARRIAGLIDSLQLGPVTLLGHSYGGGPAAEVAMLAPDKVRHLILLDAAIGLLEKPGATDDGLTTKLLGVRAFRTAVVTTLFTQPMLSEFWLRQFVARKEVVTASRTAIYQQPFAVNNFSAGLGDWAAQFASEHGQSLSETPAAFRKLAMPLTLVWGEKDTITPSSQAKALQALTQHAKLVLLPDVGHIPQIEDPALFNAEIQKILKQK